MNTRDHPFDRFLRKVRVRMWMVRGTEAIGAGLLGACLAGLAGGGWLLWHGRSASRLVEIAIAIGLTLGIVWAIYRRPTRLQAALEADRQFGLAELLSSVLLLPSTAERGWAKVLQLQAAARCQTVSPGSLILSRWGSRWWGILAVVMGLVWTLVLLGPSNPDRNRSADRSNSTSAPTPSSANANAPVTFASLENRPILLPDPDDLQASNLGQNDTATAPPAKPQPQPGDPGETDPHSKPSASSEGTGAGSARTPFSPTASPPAEIPSAIRPIGPANQTSGTAASGAGAPSPKLSDEKLASGGSSAAADRVAKPPPWRAADWPARVQQAQATLSGGGVPGAYRDLVQRYFSEDDGNDVGFR